MVGAEVLGAKVRGMAIPVVTAGGAVTTVTVTQTQMPLSQAFLAQGSRVSHDRPRTGVTFLLRVLLELDLSELVTVTADANAAVTGVSGTGALARLRSGRKYFSHWI